MIGLKPFDRGWRAYLDDQLDLRLEGLESGRDKPCGRGREEPPITCSVGACSYRRKLEVKRGKGPTKKPIDWV